MTRVNPERKWGNIPKNSFLDFMAPSEMILTNKECFGARNNIQWLCFSGKHSLQLFSYTNSFCMPELTFSFNRDQKRKERKIEFLVSDSTLRYVRSLSLQHPLMQWKVLIKLSMCDFKHFLTHTSSSLQLPPSTYLKGRDSSVKVVRCRLKIPPTI